MWKSVLLAVLVAGPSAAFGQSKHQISVSATKGPIKLTLTLYSARVKKGDPIWFRISLTNVGRESIPIAEKIFCSTTTWFWDDWQNNSGLKRGVFLAGSDPSGKKIDSRYFPPPTPFEPCRITHRSLSEVEKRLIEDWRKQGLNEDQVNSKFDAFAIKTYEDREKEEQRLKDKLCPAVDLRPHKSLSTPVWVYPGYCDHRPNIPAPPGQFIELQSDSPAFLHPGHYRISAVYDESGIPKVRKELKKEGFDPWWMRGHFDSEVRVQTPFVELEVLP